MNIRVDLNAPIKDGTEVIFRSPVDCSQVTGLRVYFPDEGQTLYFDFMFADAHGNNVGDIDHLFAENAVVKVILDITTFMAFVQNADTNAYLEGRFAAIEDEIRNAGIPGGAAPGGAVLYTEQTLTEEQQVQARANIGAAESQEMMIVSSIASDAFNAALEAIDRVAGFENGILPNLATKNYVDESAILHTEQTLTEGQKAQARANIGAAAAGESGGGNSDGSGIDYVVEQSFEAEMRYRKWASGFAEIWVHKRPYTITDDDTIFIPLPFPVEEAKFETPPIETQASFPMTHITPMYPDPTLKAAIAVENLMITYDNQLMVTIAQIGEVPLPDAVDFYAYITCFWKDA